MSEVGVCLSGEQFTALQALAARHVVFSLTEACPLKCSHCIVATTDVADRSRYLPVEIAENYASQMPELAGRGVRFVSFTGGEPLLAPQQLAILSRASAEAGMECTVVTACHWAGSEDSATRVVRRFPHVGNWHLSTDVFHTEFVAADLVMVAAQAALRDGRKALVRMSATVPLCGEHERLYSRLRQELPAGCPIAVQPVTRSGRASGLATDVPLRDAPAWPCVPNGMVVRYDGSVAPCCAGLVDQRDGHPFQYANARTAGLAAVHAQWCTDPLLQLIRTVGFAPLLEWLREMLPEHPLHQGAPEHPCECCLAMWRHPGTSEALRARAARQQNREKVAALTQIVFGETFMQPTGSANTP